MAAPRPIKGILKNKNIVPIVKSLPDDVQVKDPNEAPGPSEDDQKKSQKWDEMNILATYHPPEKEYGLMKINEASTPYDRMVGHNDEGALSDSVGHAALTADDDLASKKKSQKWDEMNILATYHPPDKEYGLMKINEPSTPYNRMVLDDDDDEGTISDSDSHAVPTADDLASKLAAAEGSEPRFMMEEEEESSEEEEEECSPEEQAKKRQFQMRRKMHYNEAMNLKLARQLIASELAAYEEDEMRDDTEEASEETEDISVDPPQDDS